MVYGYEMLFPRDFVEKNNLSISSIVLHLFIYAASLKIDKQIEKVIMIEKLARALKISLYLQNQ